MPRYTIRQMRKEDIPQVNEIDREAFPSQWPPPNYTHELALPLARYIVAADAARLTPETAAKSGNRPGGVLSRFLRSWLGRENLSGTVPSAAGRPYLVGFAGMWLMADEAHITNIAVRKSCQRHGIGELLLIHLIDLANQLNATMMTLEVRASNTTAQSLYRKYGFEEVGVRRGYYLDNREDGLLMSTPGITSTSFQEHFQQAKQACYRRHQPPLPD